MTNLKICSNNLTQHLNGKPTKYYSISHHIYLNMYTNTFLYGTCFIMEDMYFKCSPNLNYDHVILSSMYRSYGSRIVIRARAESDIC